MLLFAFGNPSDPAGIDDKASITVDQSSILFMDASLCRGIIKLWRTDIRDEIYRFCAISPMVRLLQPRYNYREIALRYLPCEPTLSSVNAGHHWYAIAQRQ
jgi:hypothetical protein